jgi:hypothetical protein
VDVRPRTSNLGVAAVVDSGRYLNRDADGGIPRGLKPGLISRVLRGPEGPLFHGEAGICDFFRSH